MANPPALNGDHVVRSLDQPVSPRLEKRRKAGKVARVRATGDQVRFLLIGFEGLSVVTGVGFLKKCHERVYQLLPVVDMSTPYNPLRPSFLMTFRHRKATSSYSHPFRTEKKTCFCLNRLV